MSLFLELGELRFEYECEIEYENNFLSHELPSLPKTSMKNEGSGNVTGLKIKNRTQTLRSLRKTKAPSVD